MKIKNKRMYLVVLLLSFWVMSVFLDAVFNNMQDIGVITMIVGGVVFLHDTIVLRFEIE
jgi:hypothetical protein